MAAREIKYFTPDASGPVDELWLSLADSYRQNALDMEKAISDGSAPARAVETSSVLSRLSYICSELAKSNLPEGTRTLMTDEYEALKQYDIELLHRELGSEGMTDDDITHMKTKLDDALDDAARILKNHNH